MDDKIETLWNIYDSINSMIKFSDTKATAILAINGVVLTIIFSNISKFLPLIADPLYRNFVIVSVTVGTLTGIVSIICSISCLIPKTNFYKDKKDYKTSTIFFGDIAKKENPGSYSQFIKEVLSKEGQLENDILQSIWINSKISANKFLKVQLAVILLGLTIFFLIIPLFIYVIPYSNLHL